MHGEPPLSDPHPETGPGQVSTQPLPQVGRLLLLHEIVRGILGHHDLPVILSEIQQGACRLLRADMSSLALWQDPPGCLEIVAAIGVRASNIGRPLASRSLAAAAFELAAPLVTNDYPNSPYADPQIVDDQARAAISVPLRNDERGMGVLSVALRGERKFTSTDVELLSLLADHAALAIEQAQLRESLAVSEGHARLVADSVPDVLITFDLNGDITFVNDQIESLLGFSPADAVGRPITDFVVPEQRDLIVERLRAALSGPVPKALYEYDAMTRDGHRVPVEATVASLYRAGRTIGRVAVVRDLTERRHLEAERLEAERRAARLEGAIRTARAAAHEFAQPLAIIVGQAELLKMRSQALPAAVVEGLDDLDAASQRLVETLHAFQKVVRYEEASHGPGLEHLDLKRSTQE